ncbi:3-deoxy-manno-octulosonate cytidylyltransferase (CMP-KDO synthetase) [Balneicella halophila]|uniref:3-deoxy-manno-octulosonate cytidylyltransferase n=1 Tax=Balneicella halophila TaxID=1537566 RepID=A0A7L4UQC2_BALHA|nr:3-deoxy-manno-octulosonate cytidylyltransferase [Balneicella halophila]PVX51966.1 3-deoxy-manno-octulosonate cytidylyltransferase (CMP-KDO synthetase) [Balneicella halophila]
MQPLVIIPARYDSTRFPGKPLALINDKPMIQHTYEQAIKTDYPVLVATDDERIVKAVEEFGGKVVLTGEHSNGTERCREAAHIAESDHGMQFDVVINVQGDEPFIHPDQIKALFEVFGTDENIDIATFGKRIKETEDLFSANIVKVVRGKKRQALYFSRSVIPYCRDAFKDDWVEEHKYLKHIGMYAYRKEVLNQIVELPEGEIEKLESLEQLRWLEEGFTVIVLETTHESIGIDTPDDLKRVNKQKNNA